MKRIGNVVWGTLIAALLVGGPFAYVTLHQKHTRHLREVRDGVLYRSGQMSIEGLKRVVQQFNIRTVVTLRDSETSAQPPPDRAEEAYCRASGIHHVRITPREWSASELGIPAEVGVQQFLAVMDEPANYPVLVHCFAGVHRTGAICAVYRMEYEGWSNAEAIAEMKRCGYHNLDDERDVLRYLENYQPRKSK